jgi:ribosomal protein S27E
MRLVKVRCWRFRTREGEELIATYPEGNMGHWLVSCLACGQVYAADVSKAAYVEPVSDRLKALECMKCGRKLCESAQAYPDSYRAGDGCVKTFDKPHIIPPDSASEVVEVPSIYDE